VKDEDKITLDTAVSGGGNNFSLGQRQIIALARAIIRNSKLLLLDEGKTLDIVNAAVLMGFGSVATSAIDYKTDSIIQNSLRTELGGDVTLITIAHRLQTIMDADRIVSYRLNVYINIYSLICCFRRWLLTQEIL